MPNRVNFTFDGVARVKNKLKLIDIGFMNEVEKSVLKATLLVEGTAKLRVPVKTGRLRRSIRGGLVRVGRGFVDGAVGANTVYAARVEFGDTDGSSNRKGKPYLSRAVSENRTKVQKIIADGLKKTLRGFKI